MSSRDAGRQSQRDADRKARKRRARQAQRESMKQIYHLVRGSRSSRIHVAKNDACLSEICDAMSTRCDDKTKKYALHILKKLVESASVRRIMSSKIVNKGLERLRKLDTHHDAALSGLRFNLISDFETMQQSNEDTEAGSVHQTPGADTLQRFHMRIEGLGDPEQKQRLLRLVRSTGRVSGCVSCTCDTRKNQITVYHSTQNDAKTGRDMLTGILSNSDFTVLEHEDESSAPDKENGAENTDRATPGRVRYMTNNRSPAQRNLNLDKQIVLKKQEKQSESINERLLKARALQQKAPEKAATIGSLISKAASWFW